MENARMFILFALGLIIIIKGGDFFVSAATWFSEILRIPKFIIGATVVSIATTLPEVFVSCIAAIDGKTDMAIGNAIGSVTANTGLILGLVIIFMPIVVKRVFIVTKSLILLITVLTLWALSLSGSLTLVKSLFLFAIFIFFILENIKSAKAEEPSNYSEKPDSSPGVVTKNIIMFVVGTAGVVIGSNLLVNNGSEIARLFGISESIIGLTAVSIGTSLPELVTAVTAIIKKESSLSVGNVIGANIIDTALILPLCAFVSGGQIAVSKQTLYVDMPVCFAVICIALVPTLIRGKFSKIQGFLSLGVYATYLVLMFL